MGSRSQTRLIFKSMVAAASILWALPSTLLFAQQDLAGNVDQARKSFQPVTQEQVSQARTELKMQMQNIEDFVQPATENGRRWLRYLHWEGLRQQVASNDAKNLSPLDATLGKLNRNVHGLERRQFRRLARALRRYRDTLAVSSWQNPRDLYNKQLDALQQDVKAYREKPTPQNEAALSQRIRILDSVDQAPELVKAVRSELAQPNAFVTISTAYIAAGVDPIDRSEPVTDCILGTNIHGDAHTTGTVGVASIPSDNKAVLEFDSRGHVWSQNTGYNSPAVIHSTSDTDYTATKRVVFTDPEFTSKPAQADATTDTHIHSVAKQGGGLGSRLVSRIGWDRAMQSKGQAEAIAADHAEDRIERRFDTDVDDRLAKTRDRYEDEYRRPLERKGEVPDHIRFSSTKTDLAVEVTQANRFQLAAQGAPPDVPGKHDMTMRLHESAVNNYSTAMLAGATATQTKPDEDVKFDVELPKWMKRLWENRKTESTHDQAAKEEPFKGFSMTLSDTQPITIKFKSNKNVEMTLHIAEMQSGDNHFSNWNVTGTYTNELADGKVLLQREGKLEVLPADFTGKLDAQQTAERNNLEKEFDKRSAQGHGFPKTIEFDPVKPEGELADAGPLEYREFSADNGWLVIGLDRQSKQAN